jgi:hypothetical protein
MRLVLTYALTLGLGILVAFGIASLIGLVLPSLETWVFLVISLWWLYIGWKYAAARSRANQVRVPLCVPEDCDFVLARDEIASFFAIANQEAEKEDGQYIFPQEMVNAWYSFRDNPCADTANQLLLVAPPLYQYFEACGPDGQFRR